MFSEPKRSIVNQEIPITNSVTKNNEEYFKNQKRNSIIFSKKLFNKSQNNKKSTSPKITKIANSIKEKIVMIIQINIREKFKEDSTFESLSDLINPFTHYEIKPFTIDLNQLSFKEFNLFNSNQSFIKNPDNIRKHSFRCKHFNKRHTNSMNYNSKNHSNTKFFERHLKHQIPHLIWNEKNAKRIAANRNKINPYSKNSNLRIMNDKGDNVDIQFRIINNSTRDDKIRIKGENITLHNNKEIPFQGKNDIRLENSHKLSESLEFPMQNKSIPPIVHIRIKRSKESF